MRGWRSANDYAKLGSLILNVETRSVRAPYCRLGMDRRRRRGRSRSRARTVSAFAPGSRFAAPDYDVSRQSRRSSGLKSLFREATIRHDSRYRCDIVTISPRYAISFPRFLYTYISGGNRKRRALDFLQSQRYDIVRHL